MKMIMRHLPAGGTEAVVEGLEEEHMHPYNHVLGGALWSELDTARHCQMFLDMAAEVQRRGGNAQAVYHDRSWQMKISPARVDIDYEFDDMGDDWKASFPLPQVLRAVKGWMRFLQMPPGPESRVVVDLDAD